MTDDLVQRLRSNRPIPTLPHEAADRIEEMDRHLTMSGKVNKAISERIEALEAENKWLRERVKRVENNNRELRGSKERVYAATDLRQPTQSDAEAMRYGFDGFGYKYIDSGSGSDWRTRHPDAEPLYLGQPTHSNIFDASDVQKHTLIVDQDYASHTIKVKSLKDSQPTQSDALREAVIEECAKALEADARLCDCAALEERECACGAWDDYKSISSARAVEIVRTLKEKSK